MAALADMAQIRLCACSAKEHLARSSKHGTLNLGERWQSRSSERSKSTATPARLRSVCSRRSRRMIQRTTCACEARRGYELGALLTINSKCIHLSEYFDFRNHPCLVSDLYGMSVFDFLKLNHFQPFPERHIQDFAKSLLASVQCEWRGRGQC